MSEDGVSSSSISEYLGKDDLRLNVPSFQRNYSWTRDQVTDFWDDLVALISDDQREKHFFGQIITYTENEKNTQIIDGQQRLTTSFIFMGALKKVLEDLTDKAKVNENIASKKIEKYGNRTLDKLDSNLFYEVGDALDDEIKSKLTLQDDFDDNIAQKCLENVIGLQNGYININNSKSESEKNINNNFKILKKKIKKYIKSDKLNDQVEKFNKLFINFTKNFKIVVIDAKDKLNAFVIFETINTRGTNLTAADIIKSHLLSFSQDDDTFAKTWTKMSNELDNDSGNMTAFVKTYVWAKYGTPTERELFRVVSKKAVDYSSAKRFLKEMNELTDTYKMLINIKGGKPSLINGLNNELSKYGAPESKKNELIDILFSLDGMGEVLHYPLILALKQQQLSLENILLIMNKIRSVIVRKNIISGKANSELTRNIARIAETIWNVSEDSSLGTNDIVSKINELKGENSLIKGHFMSLIRRGGEKGPQYNTLAYLLFELYKQECDGEFKASSKENDNSLLFYNYFDNNDLKLINLQNPDEKLGRNNDDGELIANWTVMEKSLIKDYHMDLKTDRTISKDVRIKALRRSDILSNNKLADSLEQNQNNCSDKFINDRQKKFARLVNEIWG